MSEKEIPLSKLSIGSRQCILHVENLIKDSELMLKKKRYTSSVSLAILAFEEISKENIMRLHLKLNKPMTWKIWLDISRGGKAHNNKLTTMNLERKLGLEKRSTKKEEDYLNEINKELGFPELADHTMSQIEVMTLGDILPRLNSLKQDCFYLNYSLKHKKWINFESQFSEYQQMAIAHFLISMTKRITAFQKFLLDSPKKPYQQYSEKDWKNTRKLKSRKELRKILQQTDNKRLNHFNDVAILALYGYSG